jgi:N-acetylneuraminic acid mutarotase
VWKDRVLSVEALQPLPIAVSAASGALVGDVLIIACGMQQPGEQAATNRVFALDFSAKNPAWNELPPLPAAPRIFATAAVYEGVFYLFGGAALTVGANRKIARVYTREAWSYRAKQGWKRLSDLPKPVAAAPSPAPVKDGCALLVGGDDGSRVGFTPLEKHPGFPATIIAYDIANNTWIDAGEAPAPRATLPVVEWHGAFVFPSGEVRPGIRSPEVWCYKK